MNGTIDGSDTDMMSGQVIVPVGQTISLRNKTYKVRRDLTKKDYIELCDTDPASSRFKELLGEESTPSVGG